MPAVAGWKGAAYIGGTKIEGIGTWSYSGATRNMQDIDAFGDEIVKQLPLQIVGGDVEISGTYQLDSDAGQQLLQTHFDGATEFDDLKLYTNENLGDFLTLKAGSKAIVTKCNNVGDDKSGVGTYSATIHINGELEQIGAAIAVAIRAIGIHNLVATAVGFIGELIDMGGETPIECWFEYGLTLAYEIGTTVADMDDMAATGIFEFELTPGDIVTSTLYHWRVHATYNVGVDHVLGEDQTFTTP